MRYFLLFIRRDGATEYSRIERIEAATVGAAHSAALSKHWPAGDARVVSTRKAGRGRAYVGVRWYGADNIARYDSALFVETDPPRVAVPARPLAYNDD